MFEQMTLGDPVCVWVLRGPDGKWRNIETAEDLRWCVKWIRKIGSARLRLRVIQ